MENGEQKEGVEGTFRYHPDRSFQAQPRRSSHVPTGPPYSARSEQATHQEQRYHEPLHATGSYWRSAFHASRTARQQGQGRMENGEQKEGVEGTFRYHPGRNFQAQRPFRRPLQGLTSSAQPPCAPGHSLAASHLETEVPSDMSHCACRLTRGNSGHQLPRTELSC